MQKASKANIFSKLILCKDQKTICLDTTIFLATDLTSYAKMISLWVFSFLPQCFALFLHKRGNSK